MKIIYKPTNETLAEITTNHGFTIDEACDFAGIKLMRTQSDFENENGYDIDDIELVF